MFNASIFWKIGIISKGSCEIVTIGFHHIWHEMPDRIITLKKHYRFSCSIFLRRIRLESKRRSIYDTRWIHRYGGSRRGKEAMLLCPVDVDIQHLKSSATRIVTQINGNACISLSLSPCFDISRIDWLLQLMVKS